MNDQQPASFDRSSLQFSDIIRGRRSVRAYADRPVPPELVLEVLEAARWAPSPHGRMPWRFAVLTRPGPKARLATAMAADWQRQLELDGQTPDVVATRLRKSLARINGAPVIIMPCLYLLDLDPYPDASRQQAETTMAIQSLGAAVQNMLLTAYKLGLDTGWMCAPLFCPDLVVRVLDLHRGLIPQALITLGYAARDPVRRHRLSLDSIIVCWD